jgi:hypothetical protein
VTDRNNTKGPTKSTTDKSISFYIIISVINLSTYSKGILRCSSASPRKRLTKAIGLKPKKAKVDMFEAADIEVLDLEREKLKLEISMLRARTQLIEEKGSWWRSRLNPSVVIWNLFCNLMN